MAVDLDVVLEAEEDAGGEEEAGDDEAGDEANFIRWKHCNFVDEKGSLWVRL